MTEVEKKGIEKTKIGLIICVVLVVILAISSVWLYTRIDTLETDKSILEGQVTSLQTDKNNLQSQVSSLETQVSNLTSKLQDAEDAVTALQGNLSTLTTKLDAINATMPKLKKDRVMLEVLNEPWPESYAGQLAWWQKALETAKEVDERLGPLMDAVIADWEYLSAWYDEEPTDVYTTEWVDWVLEYFRRYALYSESNEEFFTLFYDIVIADLNNTTQAAA